MYFPAILQTYPDTNIKYNFQTESNRQHGCKTSVGSIVVRWVLVFMPRGCMTLSFGGFLFSCLYPNSWWVLVCNDSCFGCFLGRLAWDSEVLLCTASWWARGWRLQSVAIRVFKAFGVSSVVGLVSLFSAPLV
jgi:hypothetical protein